MTPEVSLARRLRALKSKELDFDCYASELVALADLSDRELDKREAEMERLFLLRARVRALELKVREMESAH